MPLIDLFSVFIELLYAPFIYPSMLWILVPVCFAILLTELYFRRYPRESMGHHKSLETAIFLLFISFDIIRNAVIMPIAPKIIIAVLFFSGTMAVALLEYLHKIPLRLHHISTKLLFGYVSYISIVLVYSDMLQTLSILQAILIIFSVVTLFFAILLVKKIFFILEPRSYEEIENFLKSIEDDIRKTAEETEDIPYFEKAEKKNQPK
jgi:hypothetical protein